jgi:hypothetical protein
MIFPCKLLPFGERLPVNDPANGSLGGLTPTVRAGAASHLTKTNPGTKSDIFTLRHSVPPALPLSKGDKMDTIREIREEAWAAFAAITDVIPPMPLEARVAFAAVAAGGLLILLLYVLNMLGK